MIPGRPVKILLVDESGIEPSHFLLRKGYEVEVTTVASAMQTIMSFWPDVIAIAVPGTSLIESCQSNDYLRKKRIVICYG